MDNKGKHDLLKELMRANGISDDLFDSIMQHGDKLMKTIGLTEDHLAATIPNTKRLASESQTPVSIMTMDDNDLVNSVGCELDIKSQSDEALNDIEATVLTLALLDMEVMNGGLGQFIVNPSGRYLQLVPDALRSIGADEYAEAFCRFAENYKLDLKTLSTYYQESVGTDFNNYYTLLEKYPFSEFDNRYFELYNATPLVTKIAAYIRQHAAELDQG